MTDRRVYFFLVAALAVFSVQPIVPEFRWLVLSMGTLYLVFAGLFATADITARRSARRSGHLDP